MGLSFTDLQATWKIFKSFRLEIFQETVWFPSAFSPLWSCYKRWSANASCHIVGLIIGKPDGFSRSTLVIWLSQSDGACVTLCYQQPGPVGIALPSKTIRLVFALAYLSRVFSSQTKKRSDPLIVQLLLLNVGIQKHNCRMASKRRPARWPSAGAAIDPLGRSIGTPDDSRFVDHLPTRRVVPEESSLRTPHSTVKTSVSAECVQIRAPNIRANHSLLVAFY